MLALFLAVIICLPVLILPTVGAEEAKTNEGLTFETLGEKTSTQLNEPGKYEIKVSVPGALESEYYSEIIVMVDASDSLSGKNFESLKKLLTKIANTALTGEAHMRLTLMGFGVGPRLAGSFYTAEQVDTFLATATRDDFMQERSATNCEVALEFVREYIENSPNLKHTAVIYTSDGGANLDETPLDWSKWSDPAVFDLFRNFTKAHVIAMAQSTELNNVYSGNRPISATVEMFPLECARISVANALYGKESQQFEDAVDALGIAINAKGEEYVSTILRHIHEFSGLTFGEKYSAADIEKAFQTYFVAYPGRESSLYDSFMDLFYVILGDTGSAILTNRYKRAADASLALQKNEKVESLYHVGYTGAGSTWMNPAVSGYENFYTDKLKYVFNTSFALATEEMHSLVDDIVLTVYKDATVVDPMSDWVTLDKSTIRIYKEETVIWNSTDGWLIPEEERPVAGDPIKLDLDEKGHDRITWRIKDGALLYSDRYSLRYEVSVNENTPGFEYGKDYPANDPTKVIYKDHTDTPVISDVPIPEVEEDRPFVYVIPESSGIIVVKTEKGSSVPIPDIEFKLYRVNGTVGAEPNEEDIAKYAKPENLALTLKTDKYGKAGDELPSGTYLVVESASDKVDEVITPLFATVTEGDAVTLRIENILKQPPKDVPDAIVNPHPESTADKAGTFKVHKLDAKTESPLAGAGFLVLKTPATGETGKEYTFMGEKILLVPVMKDGKEVVIYSDGKGVALSPELPQGQYFVIETVAPSGYKASDELLMVMANANSEKSMDASVKNSAYTKADFAVEATKLLEGKELAAGEYTFVIKDSEGKVLAEAKNGADGKITFPSISLENPGNYTFTVSEIKGEDKNTTYDGKVYTLTVEVTEGEGLVLSAKVTLPEGGMVFKNLYEEPVVPPVTGDVSSMFVALAIISLALLSFTAGTKRRYD